MKGGARLLCELRHADTVSASSAPPVDDAHHLVKQHLCTPRGDQDVAVTIAPTPMHPRSGDQMAEDRFPPVRLKIRAVRVQQQGRSEERRVGKECRSRWS